MIKTKTWSWDISDDLVYMTVMEMQDNDDDEQTIVNEMYIPLAVIDAISERKQDLTYTIDVDEDLTFTLETEDGDTN